MVGLCVPPAVVAEIEARRIVVQAETSHPHHLQVEGSLME